MGVTTMTPQLLSSHTIAKSRRYAPNPVEDVEPLCLPPSVLSDDELVTNSHSYWQGESCLTCSVNKLKVNTSNLCTNETLNNNAEEELSVGRSVTMLLLQGCFDTIKAKATLND